MGWINTAKIGKALQALLEREVTFVDKVYRGQYVNQVAKNAPWCGVYRAPVVYEPRTLGRGANNWEGTPEFRVVIQASSFKDGGEDCEDVLESQVVEVLDALESDLTIGSTVDMITKIEVDYSYIEAEETTMYFQSAFVLVTTEVRT